MVSNIKRNLRGELGNIVDEIVRAWYDPNGYGYADQKDRSLLRHAVNLVTQVKATRNLGFGDTTLIESVREQSECYSVDGSTLPVSGYDPALYPEVEDPSRSGLVR